MREKSVIIICVTILVCVSIICGTIVLTHQNIENNTNNTTVNSTQNQTNNTTDNIDISLINLKGWIIRYWAYKFCKDKMHDQIEDFFLKDCDTVNDSNELDLIMYELDNKILQRCRAIIFWTRRRRIWTIDIEDI